MSAFQVSREKFKLWHWEPHGRSEEVPWIERTFLPIPWEQYTQIKLFETPEVYLVKKSHIFWREIILYWKQQFTMFTKMSLIF